MARITNLQLYSLDIQQRMTEVAIRNIAQAGLSSRIKTVTADVCKMPFDNDSIDLVVSRGSMPFWEDRSAAFREINRILKPSGVGYVGGGFGSEEIKTKVIEEISTNEALEDSREKFLKGMRRSKFKPEQIQKEFTRSGVKGTVEKEFAGFWVQIVKPDTVLSESDPRAAVPPTIPRID